MSRMDSGLRRNDECQGAIHRAATSWPGLAPGVRSRPPMVPPLRRGDMDSRFRGNDGLRKGLVRN